MLLYVAWIAIWEAVFDPRLWTDAPSSPAKGAKEGRSAPRKIAAIRTRRF
jgi:hypothetical protein